MSTENPNERVEMTHPAIKSAPAVATRAAYERVWKERGWKVGAPVTVAANTDGKPPKQ